MPLYDGKGQVVSSAMFKKAPPPKTGEPFVVWGDNGQQWAQLPQGGIVQFNLERLQIADYRAMLPHYQVNASLAVLSFMLHQSDWHIECTNQKIADEVEGQLRKMWTPLNRALSSANWAGFSANVLQWENDSNTGRVVLAKIKDLVPESVSPNWKEVDAWKPSDPKYANVKPKVKIYDGINQVGGHWPFPPENTLWYPLLMTNGNYNGTYLLKSAFQSWFFSILIHLFANRYFERFGEPLIKARAPFEDRVTLPGTTESMSGIEFMTRILSNVRSQAVVTLPDTKTEMSSGRAEFDYQLEYLESQMRGADWERYLTRLDEEISIGLFTPILLLRTADVGSYNLGVGHMQMYLWMLNAMNNDRALYIDKYINNRIVDINFGVKAPRASIKFRKLGNQNAEVVRAIVDSYLSKGRIKVDVKELGEIAGMSMEEVEETLEVTPGQEETGDDKDDDKVGSGAELSRCRNPEPQLRA